MQKATVKVLSKFILFFIIFTVLVNNFSFAQEVSCNAKNNTPMLVEEYIDSFKTILSTLPSKGTKSFSEVLNSSIAEDILTNGMPFVESTTTDLFSNFKILSNSNAVIRDRRKILMLDKLLTSKNTDYYKNGGYDEYLTEEEVSKINSSLSKISLLDGISVSDKLQRIDVVSFLWSLNILYKKVYLEATKTATSSDQSSDSLVNIFGSIGYKIGVNEDKLKKSYSTYLKALSAEYECVGGYTATAGEHIEKLKENVDSIVDVGQGGFSRIWEKFKNSQKKLDCLLFNACTPDIETQIQERQKQLLVATNNLGPGKGGFDNMFGLGDAWNKLKNSINLEPLKNLVAVDETKDRPTPAETQQKKEEKTNEVMKKNSDLDKEIKISDTIKNTFESTLKNQVAGANDIIIEDPTFLRKLPRLSQKVYDGIIIIGKRDDEATSIVKELGEGCEKQCSNKGSKKCWYEE